MRCWHPFCFTCFTKSSLTDILSPLEHLAVGVELAVHTPGVRRETNGIEQMRISHEVVGISGLDGVWQSPRRSIILRSWVSHRMNKSIICHTEHTRPKLAYTTGPMAKGKPLRARLNTTVSACKSVLQMCVVLSLFTRRPRQIGSLALPIKR